MNRALLILLIAFVLVRPAQALVLSEETDFSANQFALSLYADDEFGEHPENEDPPFDWNLSYGYQRTSTPDPDAAKVVDKTQSFAAGLGYSDTGGASLFGRLNYANTPAEKLSVRGASLTGGYRYDYEGTRPKGYSPYVNFKILGAVNQYAADYEGTTLRKRKTVQGSGTNQLGQQMLGLGVSWRPLRKWRFDLEYDRYFFNRNVSSFEANLNSSAAIQRGSSGFANTVGVLAESALIASLGWEFVRDWRVGVSGMFARLAADKSTSSTLKYQVSDQIFEDWKITAGFERIESNVFSDSLGIVAIEYSN